MDKELVKTIAEYGGGGAIIAVLLIYILRDTLNQKLGANLPAADRTKITKYLLIASATIACVSVLAWAAVNFKPTVRLQAPDKPIEIKMDIKIAAEVRVKTEKELDAVFKQEGTPETARPPGFGSIYGERYDGFLGIQKEEGDPTIKKYVEEENKRRLQGYVETAARVGIGVPEVGLIAGEANIRSLQKGMTFFSKKNKWISK